MARLPKSENRCTYIDETGARCTRVRGEALPVCEEHFESTLDATAKNSPITGRRMKALGHLRGDYAAALADPQIRNLDTVIALYEIRITELTHRAATAGGDTQDYRAKLLEMFKEYEAQLADADDVGASKTFEKMGKFVEDGVNADRAWSDLLALAARRNALVSEANDLLIKSAHVVTRLDFTKFVKMVITIVAEEADRDTAFAIINKIDREGLGRIREAGSGETGSPLEDAVRALPRPAGGLLPGGAGGLSVVDAGSDR